MDEGGLSLVSLLAFSAIATSRAMSFDQNQANLRVQVPSTEDAPASIQLLPEGETRQCPYCCEVISLQSRKCWRCHEYFSPPREDLDDRVFQLARREVLQDVVVDIKKWITRIGFGSVTGILLLALLSAMRFQDVLGGMVSDRVEVAVGPVLKETEAKLEESEKALKAIGCTADLDSISDVDDDAQIAWLGKPLCASMLKAVGKG